MKNVNFTMQQKKKNQTIEKKVLEKIDLKENRRLKRAEMLEKLEREQNGNK